MGFSGTLTLRRSTLEAICEGLDLPPTSSSRLLVQAELESAQRSLWLQCRASPQGRVWSRATGLLTVVTIDWWSIDGLLGSYLRNYAGAGWLFSDADLLAQELRGVADRVLETAEDIDDP